MAVCVSLPCYSFPDSADKLLHLESPYPLLSPSSFGKRSFWFAWVIPWVVVVVCVFFLV